MGEIPEADTYFILLESGGTIHPPFSFIENMQIITKTLREIHPYEHNPRKNDQAVDAVAESISAFGFKVPIIIDKNGTIVAGHTRYKAARKLKLKEVPCIIADDLTEEQINAFRLADNKVAEKAEWDLDLLGDELQKICDIDMGRFGFDLNTDFHMPEEEKGGGYYGDERERTFSAYNMKQFDPNRADGFWQIPHLKRCTFVPDQLIGFNYVLSTERRDAGVHFYIDDYQFERVWNDPHTYIDKLMEFPCVLTPNFSLYTDMPRAMKLWNTYRSRQIGQMMQDVGIKVIPSVCWAEPETFDFCFEGIESGGTIAVETLGVKKDEDDRKLFAAGMDEAIRRLRPSTVIVYGSPMPGYDFKGQKVKYIKPRDGWKKGEDDNT